MSNIKLDIDLVQKGDSVRVKELNRCGNITEVHNDGRTDPLEIRFDDGGKVFLNANDIETIER